MSPFNFSGTVWLWALAAIPAMVLLYRLFDKNRVAFERLKRFADVHLLPHLLKNQEMERKRTFLPLALWVLAWACGVLAMAGPRWDYTDVQTMKPERALVILLDLSKSMDTQDVKPSRLARAREEISDILDASRGVNVGLVAFAAVPHMVAPLTDDMATIRHFLPYLDTGLIAVQGSHVKPALDMAAQLLKNVPGRDKTILIVSDGGFSDTAAARGAIPAGVPVYTLGIGTPEGAPIPADGGGWVKDSSGKMVIARREEDKLRALAATGGGLYIRADYSSNDTQALLGRIEAGPAAGKGAARTVRIWDERFYIPALIMALLMLPWFRKGYIFPALMMLALSAQPARASWLDWFLNPGQQGQAAFNQGHYGAAAQKFDTPYRRGVAEYRAGQFDKAAQSFGAAGDAKTKADATYNLGNAQLMAGKPEDAIRSYESVLQTQPGDAAAAHNLAIAKKILEQKQRQQKQSSQNQQQAANSPSQKSDDKQQQEKSGQSDKKQQSAEQSKNQQNQQAREQQGQPQNAQNQQGSPEQKQQSPGPSEQNKPASQPPQQAQNQNQKNGGQPQQQPSPPTQAGNDRQQAAGRPQDAQETGQENQDQSAAPQRTPQDVDADQWLSRAASDPGPFLKNQFMIEARKSGVQEEDDPW